MKKYISSLFVFAVLLSIIISPLTSSAQTSEGNSLSSNSSCIELKNNLTLNNTDTNRNGEVTILQKFLQSKGYLSLSQTGYFGSVTLNAVIQFQKDNNISPAAGYVGDLTRAKIKELTCGDAPTNHCFNKIKDGDETGIDIGGSCGKTCPPGTVFGTYPTIPGSIGSTGCIVIEGPSPKITFTADPEWGVEQGKNVTLTWTSTNATSCEASGGWSGKKALSGSQVIFNLQKPTTFILTCNGASKSFVSPLNVPVYVVDDLPTCLTDTTGTSSACAPDSVCPTGTTGTYPNCVPVQICPTGTIGTYPNCIFDEPPCGPGYTGLAPNCVPIPPTSCIELKNNLTLNNTDTNRNGEVTILQKFLQSKGYLSLSQTGYFGSVTLNAVIQFQKDNNISPAAGYVGDLTRAKIKELTCGDISSCPTGTTGTYPNCVVDKPTPTPTYPPGCTSNTGYSITTGLSCSGKNEVCPTGTTGVYPNCKVPDLICPPGTVFGTYPTIPGSGIPGATGCIIIEGPAPTITFKANPAGVEQGKNTILTWTTQNATSCEASGGWSGKKALSGSQVIFNIQKPTIFILTCNGVNMITVHALDVSVSIADNLPTCPTGTTGTYPDCKAPNPVCPTGTTGVYPNCKIQSQTSNTGCEAGFKYSIITGQACSLQGQQVKESSFTDTSSSLDKTPRIAYWWGKVNQHIDQNGNWQTDPDGDSGANLDKLEYCKKWYPTTTSVRDYKSETINTWRTVYNTGPFYATTVTSTECVGGSSSGVLGASIQSPQNACILNSNLTKGVKSEEVRCLQKKLNQKGYNVVGTEGGKETNEFGYYTHLALRKFQAENSLKVDGIAGVNTRVLLNK